MKRMFDKKELGGIDLSTPYATAKFDDGTFSKPLNNGLYLVNVLYNNNVVGTTLFNRTLSVTDETEYISLVIADSGLDEAVTVIFNTYNDSFESFIKGSYSDTSKLNVKLYKLV